jgi:hypothetical protein
LKQKNGINNNSITHNRGNQNKSTLFWDSINLHSGIIYPGGKKEVPVHALQHMKAKRCAHTA